MLIDSVASARMVCETTRGVLVTWPGEPLNLVPEGTRFYVEACVGDGWYRGRLHDDPRLLELHADYLGLPSAPDVSTRAPARRRGSTSPSPRRTALRRPG